ncbi:hypothetical protein [Mycolicibacterium mageritense]|uniref:hypothetical protein n=1 Tax=Mycolicibacterium mageritense TaxID=53462 RepID=UPI0011D4BA94|nr:hypothetical protein [Mycolicibacterium mageritense]TXI65340.1 MAG: hypothetical protein E6Q55_02725 [Mycolicibacterium mageritense]
MRGKYAGWLLLLAGGLLTFVGGRVQHSDRQLGLAVSHSGAVAAGAGVGLLIVLLLIRNLRPAPTAPTYFYVSAIRADGVAIMVTGPYPSRDAAALDVARVQARSSEFDGASNSYGWGVSESSVRHEGIANKLLNFQPA